jgi:hypothetical protein
MLHLMQFLAKIPMVLTTIRKLALKNLTTLPPPIAYNLIITDITTTNITPTSISSAKTKRLTLIPSLKSVHL